MNILKVISIITIKETGKKKTGKRPHRPEHLNKEENFLELNPRNDIIYSVRKKNSVELHFKSSYFKTTLNIP